MHLVDSGRSVGQVQCVSRKLCNGALEPDGSSTVAAVEQPWAPKDTEELLHAIATKDYGIAADRSWSKVYPKAIQAYNGVADSYHKSVQKHGQPLHEGFWIVKVRSTRLPHAHLPQSRTGTTVPGDCDLSHLARSPACTFFPRRGSTDWASIDCHCDRPRKAFRVLLHLSFTLWTRPCARTSSARATRQR